MRIGDTERKLRFHGGMADEGNRGKKRVKERRMKVKRR